MNSRKHPEEKTERPKKGFRLKGLIYHNSFVLACSFVVALVGWFIMAAGSDLDRVQTIHDVPIQVNLSADAEADGLRVFNMSYATVDIDVAGSSMITSKLTREDFAVAVSLSPTSTKLTGNTTQKMTAPVRVTKNSATADYEVVGTSPEEIVLEYDRYKEISLNIESNIDVAAGTGYYLGTPVLSEEKVTVSGPESSVNKISRAVVSYHVEDTLRETKELTCPLRLYDQDDQEITDWGSLYLSLDVDSVLVTIPVSAKKTVPLVASYAHMPASFSDTRITIEPESIDLAGSAETLGAITEIRLDQVIDFAELDLSQPMAIFTMEIPIPQNTRNITNAGTNTLSQATVTINLNAYRRTTVTVPESNVQIINPPGGDYSAALITKSLDVTLAGPAAQINRVTGESVTVQLDMSNVPERAGSVDVAAIVSVAGSYGDACWVVGNNYTVAVDIVENEETQDGTLSNNARNFAAAPPSD